MTFGVAAALTAGCSLMVDPFRDELAGASPVGTPSTEAARAVPVEKRTPQRPFEQSVLAAKDGSVTHGPVYFEEPCETTDRNDVVIAWSLHDYLCTAHADARFLVNIVLFPVNAVVTPPWQVMVSDGRTAPRGLLQEEFDAERVDRSSNDAAH